MDRFDRATQHELEHLPLAVAAAQTYYQVMGAVPEQKAAAHLDEILNRVAHAIAKVAPLHAPDDSGQREIPTTELLQSRFRRGATVLMLKDGTELRGLTVRRVDVRAAVAVLKGINAKFSEPGVRDECYDAGMNAFLPKPFTTEELEAALSAAAGENPAAQPSAVAAKERASLLLDRSLIDEIRRIEQATGRDDMLSGFVRNLAGNLASFGAVFSDCIARGDTTGAERAAHTLKGVCRQLGAPALGDLFADIERSAKAGDYAEAKRTFDGGASLIAQSLEALKHA